MVGPVVKANGTIWMMAACLSLWKFVLVGWMMTRGVRRRGTMKVVVLVGSWIWLTRRRLFDIVDSHSATRPRRQIEFCFLNHFSASRPTRTLTQTNEIIRIPTIGDWWSIATLLLCVLLSFVERVVVFKDPFVSSLQCDDLLTNRPPIKPSIYLTGSLRIIHYPSAAERLERRAHAHHTSIEIDAGDDTSLLVDWHKRTSVCAWDAFFGSLFGSYNCQSVLGKLA